MYKMMNGNVLVLPKEESKEEGEFIVGSFDRFTKMIVASSPDQDIVTEGDIVMVPTNAGHDINLEEGSFKVIKLSDIITIL